MRQKKHKTQKKIPLSEYVYLNRRGFPCSERWKQQLVAENKAPFKWVKEDDNTYVIID